MVVMETDRLCQQRLFNLLSRLHRSGSIIFGGQENYRGVVFVGNGMPGVGKDEIFRRLKAAIGLSIISTSKELKALIEPRPDKEDLKSIMNLGRLLPHDLVLDALVGVMSNFWTNRHNGQPVVLGLNGYPRSTEQVNDLRGWKDELFPGCIIVHFLMEDIPKEESSRRILGATDRGNRGDDNPDSLQERFRVWDENCGCYREMSQIATLDFKVQTRGSGCFLGRDEVFADFIRGAEQTIKKIWF